MMTALFNHLWQSTVFAAAAALLSLAFRRNRARLRYGLWLVASVKFLVPFAVLTAAGSLVEWTQAPSPIASVMTSTAIRGFNEPFGAIALDTAVAMPATRTPEWIALSLFGVWLCGFAAVAVGRARGWRRIHAAVAASTPWDTATHVPSGIRIRTAPTVLEPGVVGLWKPVILLPAGIDTYLTARQLAAVLAHEVSHARRRDNLTAAVHMLVEALFWFHPVVWWIGARLVAEREQACDEHVVAETGEPLAYAESIVTICRRYVETPLMSVAGVGGADLKARINAILANRIGVSLTLSKGIVLAAAVVVSLVVPIATGAIDAALTAAQLPAAPGPPVDPETRFEVVSIKPSDQSQVPRMSMSPGRYNVAGVASQGIVSQALRVPPNRITGLPDWSFKERYTITAKAPEGTPSTDSRAMFVMLTNLLKDRFRMATHTETREMPVFNLVFARNDKRFGPAFKESSAECRAVLAARNEQVRGGVRAAGMIVPSECESVRINPGGTASLNGVPMDMIAQILTPYVGRPLIDKTGLTSYYNVALKWTPEVGSASVAPSGLPAGTLPLDPDAPSLFTAVQEQLGLKLENARAPLAVVVIDHVEKPALD